MIRLIRCFHMKRRNALAFIQPKKIIFQYSVLVYPDLICRTKKLFLLSVTKGYYYVLLTLCIPRGVVFISHKNRHSYNNACQVCSLLQTPADLYIFRKLGKYAFIYFCDVTSHLISIIMQIRTDTWFSD